MACITKYWPLPIERHTNQEGAVLGLRQLYTGAVNQFGLINKQKNRTEKQTYPQKWQGAIIFEEWDAWELILTAVGGKRSLLSGWSIIVLAGQFPIRAKIKLCVCNLHPVHTTHPSKVITCQSWRNPHWRSDPYHSQLLYIIINITIINK